MSYQAIWGIDEEDTDTPTEAAKHARQAQTRPGATATIFTVINNQTGHACRVGLTKGTEVRL